MANWSNNFSLSVRAVLGIVPVGGIIAIANDHPSVTGGAWTPPLPGAVKDGFMLCTGAAIPAGNTLTGSTPTLDDSSFLMGASSSGVIGGSNSISETSGGGTASWASSTVSTTFTNPTFNKNLLNSNQTNGGHCHGGGGMRADIGWIGSYLYWKQVSSANWNGNTRIGSTPTTSSATCAACGTELSGVSTVIPAAWNSANITTSGGGASFNKNVLNTNQTNHFHSISVADSRPKYMSVKYLIRVT